MSYRSYQKKQLIKKNPDDFQPGNFVLLNGKVSILDFNAYRYFIDVLPELMQTGEQTQPSQKKGKKKSGQKSSQNKEIKKISKFLQLVSDIVPWSIQIIIEDEDVNAWGAIDGSNLRDAPGNLMLKHGPTLVGDWFILGVVDALPDQYGQPESEHQETISGLMDASKGIQEGFGRPGSFLGITPLLIFRKLS